MTKYPGWRPKIKSKLIPTRTVIQRFGLVVTVIGMVFVCVGIINVAPLPSDFIRFTGNPLPTFEQRVKASDECDNAFEEQESDSSGLSVFDLDVEGQRSLAFEACYSGKFPPQREFYEPPLTAYVGKYMDYVGSSMIDPTNHWPEQALYWGIRAVLVGLFLLYLFELTIGRIIRFIQGGRPEA